MDTNEVSGQSRVEQFRDLSETDKNVIKRLTVDRSNKKGGGTDRLDLSPLSGVFRRTLRDATDIRNIFQTMPDLHLPREILISAIMSPGDLSQQTLIFGNDMKGCDTALTSPLVQNLENFFITTKKTDTKVAEWVDDALIWSGAHPILIIPEATLDRLVLGDNDASMESISSYGGEFVDGWYKPKGIFGLSVPTANGDAYVSLESASGRINQSSMAEYHTIKTKNGEKKVSLPIRVTDNMAVLRTPAVQKMKRSRVMENAYGTPSLEARKRQRKADNQKDGPGNSEIYNKFYRQPQQVRRSRLQVVPSGKQAGGGNCGHPLEYHLSTEAVMPVCVPGDESNHVGYIILLDANGYPISYSRRLNYYDDIRRGSGGSGDAGNSGGVAGELIQMSKEAIVGGIANASNSQIDRLADLHAELVDADIVARFRTGMMGGDFELSHTEHIDRLMFARTMKNQLTTMLYVPAELMIYMAYEYNEFGIGKSILEDAKSLAAMRAAVTVANVIGSTKNAIPGKDINIELPEDDGDPLGTATFMANEALGLAYHQFPMAISSTVGLAEQLQMSSFSVNVTGNPRFPEVKTSISPRESTFAQIDNELQQQLRDDLTRVFGLTPEMVDNVNQPEFATTAVQNSLMLQKRVMVIQAKTNPMLTDYVRIFTYNSGILIGELMDIIEQNAKYLPDEYKSDPEGFLEEFLNNLTVKLPAPENDNLTKQMELFNNFSETLDKALPAYISEEFFDGYAPDKIKEAMTSVVAAWKGVILRAWMRKRGILRELDVFSSAEDGSPVMDLTEEMSNHVESVMKSVGGYAKRVAMDAVKRKKTTAKTVDEIDKAQKMLEELTAEPVDENAGDDTYGGGQDLANGNMPEVTDELGGDTNGDGQDDLSMDLGDANDGVDANTNGDALTDTNTDTAADTAAETTDAAADNAEAPADDAAAKAGVDDLAIHLDAPEGAETAEAPEPAVDAPEVPAAADDAAVAPEGDKPAEADTDLNINLDEPPVDGKEGTEEAAEKPAGEDADLNIDLGEPEEVKADKEPELSEDDLKLDLGDAPAVKDDDKDKDDKKGKKDGKDDDLTIDLGEPGKPKS